MKKKDKEKEEKKKNKPKKRKKQHILLYKIVSFILIVLSVVTCGLLIKDNIFDIWHLLMYIGIIAVVVFIISFILNLDRLRAGIKNFFIILSIIIMALEIVFFIYGANTLKFLSSITDTGYRVETYGVYVLKTSKYEEIDDLDGKKINYLNSNDETLSDALKKLKKEIKYSSGSKDNIDELIESLSGDDGVDAILFPTSYEDILSEEFPDLYESIKLIYSFDIVEYVNTVESDKDITKEPFIVYISGIDTSGNVASKARSDVNILLAVNPTTGKIVLVNTPRDYYVTLNMNGKKDKLTHAGLYGVEESMNTLSDLYGVDIDYYVRINFTSFVKIVDALGGITVDVRMDFCEQNSERKTDSSSLICLSKGSQKLNGEQALAYARHRHTLATGDRARGENQMQVLEAIINKASSKNIIKSYTSLISALEGRVTTNMSTNEMYKFAKKQIKDETVWDFTTVSADGDNAYGKCYSTGSANAYVMEPNEDTVDAVKDALNNLLNGVTDDE